MNGSNMENEKTPLYVAFSTQKGGVGKTTFTVLAASYPVSYTHLRAHET